MSWRDVAKPIIRRVLTETKGQSESQIKAALRAAYPFGERAMYPYKAWLDEIQTQRGFKYKQMSAIDTKKAIEPLAGQMRIFDESTVPA